MKYPSNLNRIVILVNILLSIGFSQLNNSTNFTKPEKHFRFTPGSDGKLFLYEDLISYLEKLDKESPKLKLLTIGNSSLEKDMYIVFISSEENIKNLEKLKEINKKLALDPGLTIIEREKFFKEGKIFFLATLSMHSNEVGPSQSAPLIAYDLISSDDSLTLKWLDDVVYMMVPCHNPDGMNMIVNHFNKYKNTKWDGSSLPGVYHEYIGHNINRDFVTLSQDETNAISGIYTEWFPQVMVEKHQMGSTGPRYFVPPFHDPIAENIDESIWNWIGIFGSNMSKDMTKAGQAGVSQHYLFDDYWPGSTETCIWKGIIGMLTEAASVQYANPIYVEQNELKVSGKGLSEYKKSVNMPLPWKGGWWRLSDIVDYEISSTKSILKTASLHRKDILEFRNDLCQKEVLKGTSEPPYYYILPQIQHDYSTFVKTVNLLRDHGVSVYKLKDKYIINNENFYPGDIVIPLAQPFRAFIKEVMEKQKFPLRHYTPNGEIIKPYDITSWSIPLHKGVKSVEIVEGRFVDFELLLDEITDDFKLTSDIPDDYWALVFNVNNNESYKVAFHALSLGLTPQRLIKSIIHNGNILPEGSFLIYGNSKQKKLSNLLSDLTVAPVIISKEISIATVPIKLPRIALVESYFHDMDAGWTRFIFDNYYIPYNVIRPGDFAKIDFARNYDVVIFPDRDKSVLMDGKWKSNDATYNLSSYPPEFTKGIGEEGIKNLLDYLNDDGIIISWGASTELFSGILKIKHSEENIEEFQLPFKDISKDMEKNGLYCPGSFLKISLAMDHPITLGMQQNIGIFSRGRPIFSTSIPSFDMDRRVVGKYADEQILLSGYCENEEELSNKSNIIWLRKGNGQLVLFGFSPLFRGSTDVSYKLIFNSILLHGLE